MTEREFGHNATSGPWGHIDLWGAGPFTLTVGGKDYHFEDSDRFGPNFVSKAGRVLKKQITNENDPFWRAHHLWRKQGRKMADNGKCSWFEPTPTLVKRVKREIIVLQQGDEANGAQTIDITDPVNHRVIDI